MKVNKSIYVEYASLVDMAILATTQHPTGKDSAFHLARNITRINDEYQISYLFYFYPMSPWIESFNTQISWLHDSGLWHEFIWRSK